MKLSRISSFLLLLLIVSRMLVVFFCAPKQVADFGALKEAWLHSQYNLNQGYEFYGNMGDEDLRTYAALEYLKGQDPSRINFEDPPLVKYLFGISYAVFANILVLQFLFASGILVCTYLIGRAICLGSRLALLPLLLLSFDKLFVQKSQTVNLDLPQLFFVLIALLVLMKKKYTQRSFVFLGISIGAAMASKVMFTGLILLLFVLAVLYLRKIPHLKKAASLVVLVGLGVYIFSYSVFFFSHPVMDFVTLHLSIAGFYRSYVPEYPWFEIWRILFLGRWRTWFATPPIQPVEEHWLVWPVSALLTFSLLFTQRRLRRLSLVPEQILLAWLVVYLGFQSIHVVFPRYLLLALPLFYILATQAIQTWLSYSPAANND
ncbi:MAG: hypothetical protein A3A65_03085 [Candidatus Chisholmbacteria bacterium RIFCSPLOWO2_01_FULL_49_14]|uniref:Glycosyltransferase RgtA/B/C/D-like domain-containing protein n=1 Tax=Candidatus Chisholmbacteria bacterium RIFCSPLOWO2_01_FULL_49_14 TaxID=1797593 RepID=A0A1G1W2W1_9BACT|nr:MAG: hypothetical protein A3A65_03085 [Candidatus Chisholmbacteria bacterium RIFCSPLOWO2_01_FULL_49_14]